MPPTLLTLRCTYPLPPSFFSLGFFADLFRIPFKNRNEGFVVCDANFQRIKVKSPQYVAITGLTYKDASKMNQRRMLQVYTTLLLSLFIISEID